MYKQEAVTFLMQKWESLALFYAHTKSNLLPKTERKIKEKLNIKKHGRKEIANLIPIRHFSRIVILTLTENLLSQTFDTIQDGD